jgi:hypothetical protein
MSMGAKYHVKGIENQLFARYDYLNVRAFKFSQLNEN